MPDFEPLYTSDEMRAAEAGHDTSELMERAGAGAAELALQIYSGAERWTVVCGGGSNGGDGRIVARHLVEAGKDVQVVDAKAGPAELGEPHVIVDALFGTGFSGEPRAEAAALIEEIWRTGAHVLAIDIPSGVDASTGEIRGAAIRADETVTFHGRKVGLVVAPGRFNAGPVHVVDIGLELGETAARLATFEVLRSVPRRSEHDNKYTAGHVLVVGGSRGYTGAPSLTALAAMRADAGYVTVAVPESTLPVLEQRLVEAVKRPLPDDEGVVADGSTEIVLELAQKASAVALGPGLGRGRGPQQLVRRLLAELTLPVVVDADALFELEPADWPGPRVLTPHEGELARLLGTTSEDVAAHRLASVRAAVERFGCVVVLKGPDTLIAAPGHDLVVSALGLPSLATAGTGDVLTGIVAAFLAKGVEPHRAAAAAVVAQQCASVEAPQRAGLVASDLIDALPRVLGAMHRSELTIDLAALRRNARTLLHALAGSELWAVVKANGYGHGAADVAGAALGAGATALCVATVPEGLELRSEFTTTRIVVMGPAGSNREVALARDAALELVVSSDEIPPGVRVHLKLDTGMGRWGLSELPAPPFEVVGLMSHLATADTDAAYTEWQIDRFRTATAAYTHLKRHIAHSAGALRYPSSRFDAARCGIALYGLSPFGTDPMEDGLEPVLSWTSHLAQCRLLRTGESTGYGRRFVAERDTWIGLVPVGYADGFRRDLTGTEVRVAGELRRVVGTVSMDAFAVELDRELAAGTPVVLIGRGMLAEDHARIANTITYELVCGISSDPARARRVVSDG